MTLNQEGDNDGDLTGEQEDLSEKKAAGLARLVPLD